MNYQLSTLDYYIIGWKRSLCSLKIRNNDSYFFDSEYDRFKRYCSWHYIILISVSSVITGAAISLMTVSFSQNRMKGMAITKLSGLIVISSFVPFFADKNIWWTVSFIPPFWLGVGIKAGRICLIFISCIISIIWLGMMYSVYSQIES